ncbi:MAG: hypothetical protein ACYSN7_00305, partial [Planctomycetota bacterium]
RVKKYCPGPDIYPQKTGLQAELQRHMKQTGYRKEVHDLSPDRQAQAPEGAMLHLSFDSVDGTTLTDLSGNGINGQIHDIERVKDCGYSAGRFTGKNFKTGFRRSDTGPWRQKERVCTLY